uniref:Uncharacterized protein n=1 Tax=Dechloromonas aromatica (strain RCB) TaxID=159087 RepID=Q47EA2_DECAR
MRPAGMVGPSVYCRLKEKQMIKPGKTLSAAVMMAALLVALSACQKKEGPVEQAGKKVDQAAEKAGQQIEKAGNKIQDAAQGDKK